MDARNMDVARGRSAAVADPRVFRELWISLASLLRSYTAAHGLGGDRHALVEADEDKITVRHEEKWLRLERDGAFVTWTRENGGSGRMEISDSGRLRSEASEEEMDLAAEAWARELMR
jgi:hypothetical protein